MPVERVRLVLDEDDHVAQAGVDAVAEREVDDAVLAAERHGGLGAVRRQGEQALAASARQDHGEEVPHGAAL
ncbi:MAG: hypothetical protein A2062_02675 [Omnitrophica WOR_2 bacterium GWA2_44_7]|nr:MAG: hypothetical protein A2062_02675 [Omnitrophica WOR_2 bacterium GWA2_44_7]